MANETYIDCLESVFQTAFVKTSGEYDSFDVLSDDNCEKIAKEFSLKCQMGCPCNPDCPKCSEMEDTCNADFCPVSICSVLSKYLFVTFFSRL